ncbi:MAG: type II toxin-antitoxin system RelE family toxin [Candidatus Ranarchaeia archaeon]
MGRYRVLIAKRTDNILAELKDATRKKIIGVLSDLANFPFLVGTHDMAKLKGRTGYYRIRVGKIRIIFKVDKPRRTIVIENIGHRKGVYK